MSKAPDAVDALLLRIRTMKWQAVSVLSTSKHGLAREEAAALVATLDAIASAMSMDSELEAFKAAQRRIDAIAILRDHAPLTRTAGRS